jgi:uncharacterized membrane protein YhdT
MCVPVTAYSLPLLFSASWMVCNNTLRLTDGIQPVALWFESKSAYILHPSGSLASVMLLIGWLYTVAVSVVVMARAVRVWGASTRPITNGAAGARVLRSDRESGFLENSQRGRIFQPTR